VTFTTDGVVYRDWESFISAFSLMLATSLDVLAKISI
jgi:hypothetical protein